MLLLLQSKRFLVKVLERQRRFQKSRLEYRYVHADIDIDSVNGDNKECVM